MNQITLVNEQATAEQKYVDFAGTQILATKTNDGKVYVAVKWVCEGIGLSEGQMKSERKKVQEDLVLSRGGRNFHLLTKGGMQEVLCIELDFLPLWLAKISITPNMQKETPWVADRLIDFQIKAKDVLAEAFFKKEQPMSQIQILAQAAQQLALQEQQLNQLEQRTNAIEQNQQNITNIMTLDANSWRKNLNKVINRIADVRGGREQYQQVRRESYEILESRGKCKLDIRLNNRKKEMKLIGISNSKISNFTKLDVVAEDSRLTEIYIAIVKEMAIKTNVNFKEELSNDLI